MEDLTAAEVAHDASATEGSVDVSGVLCYTSNPESDVTHTGDDAENYLIRNELCYERREGVGVRSGGGGSEGARSGGVQ